MPARLGDVFRFSTAKARGHDSRNKFHVAIDLGTGTFLFINSDPFEGAMRITRADWPEMPKNESYISLSSTIRYTRADLTGVDIEPAGRLTDDCLRRLEEEVASSLTLTIQEIDSVLLALRSYFKE